MSLTELLVAMTLMGIVLAGAYGIAYFMQTSQRQTDAATQRARAVSYPLDRMREILMQNMRVEAYPAPSAYSVTVRTDQNVDDVQERHVFSLATASGLGTYIQHVCNLMGTDGSIVSPPVFVHQLGEHLTNVDAGVPLFRYYDRNGVEITNMALVPSDAAKMVVTMRVTVDSKTLTESTDIFFRNRE